MKAIVLCAGLGTRLRPLTDTLPKPMIPIAGEPLLFRHLRALRDAGVTDVAMNLHHLGHVISDAIGEVAFGMRAHYAEEEQLRGSAGALNGFPGFFDQTFFVVYADVYHAIDLKALAFFHATQRSVLTMAATTADDPTTKGVIQADAKTGRVSAFVEKPQSAPQDSMTNVGLYVCEPMVAAMIPPGPSDFGADVIPSLIAAGEPVYALPVPSLVLDVGTPEGLEHARRLAGRS